MANHKKKRAPKQRASARGCVQFGNGLLAQSNQERRARASAAAGWSVDDFSWLEPDGSEGAWWPPAAHPGDIPPQGKQHRRGRGRGKEKPFILEARWAASGPSWMNREWFVLKRYRTEAQRAQGLAQLIRAGKSRVFGPYYEFRVPEDPSGQVA